MWGPEAEQNQAPQDPSPPLLMSSSAPSPGEPAVYANEMRLRDLRGIAKSSRDGADDVVKTYYAWREARAMAVAKGLGGAALSILAAWLIPFLKDQYKGTPLG